MKSSLVVIFGAFMLAGCATYNVAGQFENGGQSFVGTVSVQVGQEGTLSISSLDGSIQCEGISKVTKNPSGFSYIGAQGYATATCNDGRTMKIDFFHTTETGGRGQGIDNRGGIVLFYFDNSAGLAKSMLDQQRINSLIQ